MRSPSIAVALVAAAVTASPAGGRTLTPLMRFAPPVPPMHGIAVPLSEAPLLRNPALLPPGVKEAALARAAARGPRKAVAAAKPPSTPGGKKFVTDDSGYIYLYSGRGPGIGTLIATITSCPGAEGARVDAHHNLWVACTDAGTIEEFPDGSTVPALTYNYIVNGIQYYAGDVTIDGYGNVYASSIYALACNTSSCTFYPGGIAYWLAGDPSGAEPDGVIPDPNINEESYFFDVDTRGENLYVDYLGCTTSTCGYAADHIAGSNAGGWSIATFIPLGAIGFPGGVGVETFGSETGDVLLLDQLTRTLTQYSANGTPTGTAYGPTPESVEGSCDPVDFGIDHADKFVVAADAGCRAIMLGRLSTNTFEPYQDIDFVLPVGAGFFESNKRKI
jgi:hypothetical protein